MRIQGGFWIVLSSLIAFVGTCVPLGTPNVLPARPPQIPPPVPDWLPWVAGLVVGVGVGSGVGLFWFRAKHRFGPTALPASDESNR